MVLTLYGSPLSPSTSLVEVILKEKGVPYENVTLNILTGENRTEKWKKVAPFGQVPWIVDEDGTTVYEARAIVRYLAQKFKDQGTPLLPNPTDYPTIARFEQAASIEQSHFDPPAFGAIFEHVFKPMKKMTPDPAITQSYLSKVEAKLDTIDFVLSQQKYLAGDELTLVDFFYLPYGHQLDLAGFPLMSAEKRPHLAKWWKEISSRKTWTDLNISVIDVSTLW